MLRPSAALHAVSAAAAAVYFWRGYRAYSRGDRGTLLTDPIAALIVALAILAASGIAYVLTSPRRCPQVCRCGMQEVLKVSFAPPDMRVCLCYPC